MQRQNSKHVTVQKPLDLIGTLKSWRSYKADQLLLGLTKTGPLKCENNAACCVEQLFLLKLAYGSGFFCFVFCLINSSVLLLCRLWVRMCGEYYCLNATACPNTVSDCNVMQEWKWTSVLLPANIYFTVKLKHKNSSTIYLYLFRN